MLENAAIEQPSYMAGQSARLARLPIQGVEPEAYSQVLTGVITPVSVDTDALRKLIYERFDLSLWMGLGENEGPHVQKLAGGGVDGDD